MAGKEETLWKQRAKAFWLVSGDRNTRFFHAKANERRVRKEIKKLKDEKGVEVRDKGGIQNIVSSYFHSMFAPMLPSVEDMEVALAGLEGRVTYAMNESLLLPFTSDEITQALQQMDPLKSPGPDGMPPIFYQKFWSIVGPDVCASMLNCLNNDSIDPLTNFTHIVLIPKCLDPSDMTQFRPISLCNVLYKLASKAIANRIKPFLSSIISTSQAAFVPHRLITDNVLAAYELNHYIKHKKQGLGFHHKFVHLIMSCVTTLSFSFLLNGEQFGFLRSEEDSVKDPLSPSVSLCAEAFSGLIRKGKLRAEFVVWQSHVVLPPYPTFYLLMTHSSFVKPLLRG
ncbi:UNVERIFIED_CONTAM: hypothetical protein Sradi_1779100 [Sesamum radiatum]|uniref:Reverse transcriptase domain-containing protein n=1 Tax=Sesamum radiatum TaxID=300843 RepID=A0AAW2TV53_SESRA